MSAQTLFSLPQPTLSVVGGSSRFPVRRVYCVGRNYAAHAREMGKDPTREAPFFFMKPATAIVEVPSQGASIPYPSNTRDFQHEIELVAAIGSSVSNVTPERALEHVLGYAVGLDMTRRDLQLAARDAGRPWELGKSFGHSAPVGALRLASEIGHPKTGAIRLAVNGQTRQRSDLADLIWSVAECVSYLSGFDPLEPGDLLFTGTPAGIAAVGIGDVMHGEIDDIGEIHVTVARGLAP